MQLRSGADQMTTTTMTVRAVACSDTTLAERWHRDWLLGRRWFLGALLLSWFALAIGGMVAIWQYETTAGPASEPPRHWPSNTNLQRTSRDRTLVLFAHPKCPCTRASLAAISAIAREYSAVATHVVFFRPTIADDSWQDSELCRTAMANPALQVTFDAEGREMQCFGVRTSGHAVLYSSGGTLEFTGGVTSARGQTGDSIGRRTLVEVLAGSAVKQPSAPVFGCPLTTPGGVCPVP